MNKHIIIIFLIAIILVACSTNQVHTPVPIEDKPASMIPDWVLNPPPSNELYRFSVGIGNNATSADKAAREEMAASYETFIKSSIKDYMEDNNVNGEQTYSEYLECTIVNYTEMNLPGVQIIERQSTSTYYYSLARLSIAELEKHQLQLKNDIFAYIRDAEEDLNIASKVEKYLMAAALIVKTVYPIEYHNKPIFLHIHNRLSQIFSEMEFSNNFSINDETGEVNQIIITPTTNGSLWKRFPFVVDDRNAITDVYGNLYLDYDSSLGRNLDYSINLNLQDVSLPDNIRSYELDRVYKLLRNITGENFSLNVTVPVIPKVYVQTNINSEFDLDTSAMNKAISRELLNNQIRTANTLAEANTFLNVDIDVSYSSHTPLGHCYKTTGNITLVQEGNERDVITLNSVDIEEETKSFHDQKERSASKSLNLFRTPLSRGVNDLIEKLK